MPQVQEKSGGQKSHPESYKINPWRAPMTTSYSDIVKGNGTSQLNPLASAYESKNSWIQPCVLGNESAAAVTKPQSRGGNLNPMWGQNSSQFQVQIVSEICHQVIKSLSNMNLMP